ncbi:formate C-acetyltransferase glycine radical, partial [Photobacterium phosphoreum]|nr:formate C-acetyltransferase glycine radical [Photobacterium phosphoreum]
MIARLRKLLNQCGDVFWLLPGVMVLTGIIAAIALVEIDRSAQLPAWLSDSRWFYSGGGTGARTLLGTIASSTIGVAGTVFLITIAA